MIEKQTVLILGAGASMLYGFPSGRELLYEIRGGLMGEDHDFFRGIKELGIKTDHIKDFYRELTYADPPSVDSFLEHRIQDENKVGRQIHTFLCKDDKCNPMGNSSDYSFESLRH